MILRPITSEKAVKLIDMENTLQFEAGRSVTRAQIKKEIEKMFNVKVAGIRTFITKNKKYAYVRLAKENPAIDIATRLGMI
jgi:large subunit ribosomal protein L23